MSVPCACAGSSRAPAAADSVTATISTPPQPSSASPPGERITMISVEHTALFRRRPVLITLMAGALSGIRQDRAGHTAGNQGVGEFADLVGGRTAQLTHRFRDVVHTVDVRLADQPAIGV